MNWGDIATLAVAIIAATTAVTAIVTFLVRLSSKVDGIAGEVSKITAILSKHVESVQNLGVRTAKLEGNVEGLYRLGHPSRMNDDETQDD